VLHADQVTALKQINGVEIVEDYALVHKDMIRVEFTPRTNECREQWFGKPFCQIDKRKVDETDTYQAILSDIAKFCDEDFTIKIQLNGLAAGKYRAIFGCAGRIRAESR